MGRCGRFTWYKHVTYLTKTYQLKAAHMLEHELKINSGKVHGHLYVLEVTVTGEPDSVHGMIISRNELSPIDHHNRQYRSELNTDCK